jgi:UDP-glucose 4-epimerase
MRHSRILVTGGAGFIGSNLIKHILLHNPDAAILSLDAYTSGSQENHVLSSRVKYLNGFTHDINSNDEIVSFGPEIVYHCGEYSRIVNSFDAVEWCHSSNVTGTFQVLQFCRPGTHTEKGSRLVYAGSSSKFGNNGQDENLSPYAWMKAKNVELIKNYHEWFGLDYVITYFFNVYGPGHVSTGSYQTLIGIFEQCVRENRPITVVEPGTQRRDLTHVDDIVRGMVLAGEKGECDEFLLGTGRNYSIIEIAEAFDHPWSFIPERRGERLSSLACTDHAREVLGWQPEKDVIEYIKQWKSQLLTQSS